MTVLNSLTSVPPRIPLKSPPNIFSASEIGSNPDESTEDRLL